MDKKQYKVRTAISVLQFVLLTLFLVNWSSASAQENCPPNLDDFFEADSNYLELLTSDVWIMKCIFKSKSVFSIVTIQEPLVSRMEQIYNQSACEVKFDTTDTNIYWWLNAEDGFIVATFNYGVESYRYQFIKVTPDFVLLDVYVPRKPFKHSAPYSKWRYKESWYLTRH